MGKQTLTHLQLDSYALAMSAALMLLLVCLPAQPAEPNLLPTDRLVEAVALLGGKPAAETPLPVQKVAESFEVAEGDDGQQLNWTLALPAPLSDLSVAAYDDALLVSGVLHQSAGGAATPFHQHFALPHDANADSLQTAWLPDGRLQLRVDRL
eukprot:PLAT4256.1.p1 GENE.PLAT4256.1~~PLAT4256.1.p1  ORF type:complete len:175 (+),score=45.16 PLAT4256.1:68-526(+)